MNSHEVMPNKTEVLIDMQQCARRMIELFTTAQTCIYYSSFVCQMNVGLPGFPHITMHQLTSDAVKRGVSVKMLFNPSTQYGNEKLENMDVDPGVEVRSISGDGCIPTPLSTIFGETYTNHHQKFLFVDGKYLMVGGVGVHPCRSGWLELNTESPPYYWHEVGVVTECTPEMSAWFEGLWQSQFTPPPFPLVAASSEHLATLKLIQDAKSCIHMEAQLCISTDSTSNKILSTVVDRLVRAQNTKGDRFCFIMLVNTHQPDEHVVVSSATTLSLHWSRRMMMECATKRGVSPLFLKERVFMGTLEHNDTHIKVHSNLIIQDGHTMIRTSSNLTDRSLSQHPCDNELGIVISGESVAQAQQALWKRYLMLDPQSPHMMPVEVLKRMSDEMGVVKRIKFNPTHDTTFLPNSIVNFFMKGVHKLPFFGGVKPITWETK